MGSSRIIEMKRILWIWILKSMQLLIIGPPTEMVLEESGTLWVGLTTPDANVNGPQLVVPTEGLGIVITIEDAMTH